MMYRTTFSATPRVAKALKDRAQREGKSISSVINEMLESCLSPSKSDPKAAPYEPRTFALNLKPGLDPTRLNQYADELDDEIL